MEPTLYGSILKADNGTYWYTCGAWRLRDMPSGIPSILAYAPESSLFPRVENQKTIDLDGIQLVKVSNQPLDVYSNRYLPGVASMIFARRFGRLVFLDESRIVEVRSPRRFAKPFLSQLRPEGGIVAELLRELGVTWENIGIWGSSLLFDKPVLRHEIDVVIYGREHSNRAFERTQDGSIDPHDLTLDPSLGLCTVFRYRGVAIDLFFDAGATDDHPLYGADIQVIRQLSNEEIVVQDDTDALYYPSTYWTTTGRRLLSFRPVHSRRFFRPGSRIRFDSISLIAITWPTGEQETAYGVLNYEQGQILE